MSTRWTFLSNHGKALLCIAGDPGARLRDIALTVDIIERRAHDIVTDLATAGYVVKSKEGRRNSRGHRSPGVGSSARGAPRRLPTGSEAWTP